MLDIDDHSTGRRANVSHLAASESLVVLETDVLTDDLASRVAAVIGDEEVAAVVHLASAASPPA